MQLIKLIRDRNKKDYTIYRVPKSINEACEFIHKAERRTPSKTFFDDNNEHQKSHLAGFHTLFAWR